MQYPRTSPRRRRFSKYLVRIARDRLLLHRGRWAPERIVAADRQEVSLRVVTSQ